MHHWYLDSFSIVGSCVVAQGWSSAQDFRLWYGGVELPLVATTVSRPYLVEMYADQGAAAWGFAVCAALPFPDPDPGAFRLQIAPEIVLDDPGRRFTRADDGRFEAMTAAFRDEVARRRGVLLEIGSRARSGNVYRSWFPDDIRYIGLDVAAGPNVDLVGDAHHLSRVVHEPVDFVFSMATFEHILMPWKVALEMNKVMAPGGLALIVSHNAWPLHEEPWDFFRFSKESWSAIFNRHTGFEIVDAQYQHQAAVVPQYASSHDLARLSGGYAYLLSGCVARKTGPATVAWKAEAAEVYDLNYAHA